MSALTDLTRALLNGISEDDAQIILDKIRTTKKGKKIQIESPGSAHSDVVGTILANIYIGHHQKLTANLPNALWGSGAVVLHYQGKVVLAPKTEKYHHDEIALAAGWFNSTKDKNLVGTALREVLQEAGIPLDETKLQPLSFFTGVRKDDDRMAEVPVVQAGWSYELSDLEWIAIQGYTDESGEMGQFELFDEATFEKFVTDGKMAFADQINFIRQFFAKMK